MEFKSLKNIETTFKQIRLFGIVFLVLCAGITGYSVFSSYKFAEEQRQRIYVLDGGKSLMLALSQDMTLSPDKSAIEGNVSRALFLVDRSAFKYYQDMQEKGYYNRIVSSNINQIVQVDSIACNFDVYPYKAVTYARQMIIRQSNITERSLVTRCDLINSVRSDNNPHGFTMEKFEIVENRDIRVTER